MCTTRGVVSVEHPLLSPPPLSLSTSDGTDLTLLLVGLRFNTTPCTDDYLTDNDTELVAGMQPGTVR